jgi:zinc D-Ala-D-Ala carboxypeptidase
MRMWQWLLALCALMIPAGALAITAVQLCPGQNIEPMPDGRMLGHLPYPEAGPADLVTIPAFGAAKPCQMHRDAAAAMAQLLAAAAKVPGVGGQLRGLSCFRTIEYQRRVFCGAIGPGRRCKDAAERARSSAPPAYSEHSTGYALDFAVRPLPRGCADVSPCIARTAAGQWLLAHATEFGFELSFPPNNAQGVTWEPWHWRWVGVAPTAPGAATARALFATARTRFPASPAIPDLSPEWINALGQPGAPTPLPSPTPTPVWPKAPQ